MTPRHERPVPRQGLATPLRQRYAHVSESGGSVKLAFVASMLAAAYGAQTWPAATLGFHGLDARPEAIVTGGALLALASLLRRAASRARAASSGATNL